ncbi:protein NONRESPONDING TO OXYLIPINS 2, mitochondrial isoform X1 [Gastrolobium bilobum]|uniref:protein NONRESPONDING TO OXYLIPINS 2, mitochondrial isoform X1 n=2 Tax=Gastrolobium bilobum TaxID=150636 RepID=UPI002AAF1FE1|nr:protein NONRESPONDING TO OXYLIPINS 2, mitochondrial isoform X1 [Gastrolobium bilobum]
MASMASVARVASRSLANRSRSFSQKSSNTPFLLSSPSATRIPRASRILTVIGSVGSLMPLHSAIANARLTSNIALDSTCWSWLSQGLEKTL